MLFKNICKFPLLSACGGKAATLRWWHHTCSLIPKPCHHGNCCGLRATLRNPAWKWSVSQPKQLWTWAKKNEKKSSFTSLTTKARPSLWVLLFCYHGLRHTSSKHNSVSESVQVFAIASYARWRATGVQMDVVLFLGRVSTVALRKPKAWERRTTDRTHCGEMQCDRGKI